MTKVIMSIYYLESCCISCSEVLRKVTFLYTSLDYTDTIITVHDVALVEDSLKKLRDREVNDLTESTVAMTQGKPRLVIGHRLNKQNTEYYINSPQFNAIFHIYIVNYVLCLCLYFIAFCIHLISTFYIKMLGIDKFLRDNKALLQFDHPPVGPEDCNKDTGGNQKSMHKWSRGLMHFVRGSGFIDSWSPLFV